MEKEYCHGVETYFVVGSEIIVPRSNSRNDAENQPVEAEESGS